MKKYWLFLGLAGMVFLSGCFNKDQKGEELIVFYNHWMENWEIESSTYSSLDWAEDAEEMLFIIETDILPVLTESIDYLEHTDVEYRAVNDLNELLLDRESYLLALFQELADDLTPDSTETEIEAALDKFNESSMPIADKNEEILETIDTLMDKYNVYWITEYDSNGEESQRLGKDR